MMGCKDDFNYTVQEAQALYDLVQGESKELIFYDSGHLLPEGYEEKAIGWFITHLK